MKQIFDRLVTVGLSVSIASMALLAWRGFDPARRVQAHSEAAGPAPSYVAGWKALRNAGVISGDTSAPVQINEDAALSFAAMDRLTRLLRDERPEGVGDLMTLSGDTDGRVQVGPSHIRYKASELEKAPHFIVGPVPSRILGGSGNPTPDLTTVAQATIYSDGRIVSFSPLGPRLLSFSPDGRGDREIGRPGRGPKEFLRPTYLARARGDTAIVLDEGNKRLVWISPSAGIVREKDVRNLGIANVRGDFATAGVLPNGAIVLFNAGATPRIPEGQRFARSPVTLAILANDGPASTITTFPGLEFAAIERTNQGHAERETDLVRLTARPQVVVWDSVIVSTAADWYRLEMRNPRGGLAGVLEVEAPRRAVSAAMRRRAIADEIAILMEVQTERRLDSAALSKQLSAVVFADSIPAIHSLHVSPNQTLWVVDGVAPGDPSWTATAFRLDGRILRRLAATGIGAPWAFGNESVVTRHVDEDGVVSLRVYPILRR